jgi:hypothetical protein
MNLKKYLEKRIHGWLPKEPNLPVFQRTNRRRIFNKTWLFWLCVGIIMAILVSGAFFFTFFVQNIWQSVDTSVAESEDTMNSFIYALNNYDANTAWSLMSPALQTSYGTIYDFNDTVITVLRQSAWHAQVLSVISINGDFTLPGSIVRSSAHIKTQLQVTRNGVLTNVTYTFDLVKPSEWWRINNKLTIT